MFRKEFERKGAVEKENFARESQGSCHQDEIIGGKPLAVE
jgi:hypothetical protein